MMTTIARNNGSSSSRTTTRNIFFACLILGLGVLAVALVVTNLSSSGGSAAAAGTTSGGLGRTFVFELANLTTGTGRVVIETHPDWAPLGVAQFHKLMDEGFYKDCMFFRVVPDFVVQFGIPAVPRKEAQPIRDDPVRETNSRGTITFATSGPDTRTTQLFINTNRRGNAFLDDQGFSPIARVVSGMEHVDRIYAGYGEEPEQGEIEARGNEYLKEEFPLLSYIREAKPLVEDTTDESKNPEEGGV